MPLEPGTRVGPYVIVAPLGQGGMGEVYRARDERLGRDIALKMLAADLATDPEALARFEREARVVAALNHQHIAALYDIGRHEGLDYLVMELVEGETLADRLKRGPLPLADALRHAVQIADALDRAHAAGVIHRDLKPGNVILSRGGVKLLDFGLAKTRHAVSTHPPTAATHREPITGQGMLLGTLQYMAPEQLEGHEADVRSDIWAFGCVLYEMISGRHAFDGSSQATLIAAILAAAPPPLQEIVPLTPPAVDRCVRMCLERDAEERWQSVRDLRRELTWIAQTPQGTQVLPTGGSPQMARWLPWIAAAVALIAAAWLGVAQLRHRRTVTPVIEVTVPAMNDLSEPATTALSPDGNTLAYAVAPGAALQSGIWLRRLASADAVRLPETDGGRYPFWSPTGTELGYLGRGYLWTVPRDGGQPHQVCPALLGVGGTWNADGTIVFTGAFFSGLSRVNAATGTVSPLTTLDASRHETAHAWPLFLPDGKHVLFTSRTTPAASNRIEAVSIDDRQRRVVTEADALAGYASPWLLFVRKGVLYAQAFDVDQMRLSGEPRAVVRTVSFRERWVTAGASVSGDRLAFVSEHPMQTLARWFDSNGRELGVAFRDDDVRELRVGPDGRHVAISKATHEDGADDVWILDLTRGGRTRLTETRADEDLGAWTPDSAQFLYASDLRGAYAVQEQSIDGLSPARAIAKDDPSRDWTPDDISRDGKWMVSSAASQTTPGDLWLVPMADPDRRVPWLATSSSETGARFSPDGRWLAFQSDQSGELEIYARPVTGKLAVQISGAGGTMPHWAPDNHTLYYTAGAGSLYAVKVEIRGDTMIPSTPRLLTAVPGLLDFDVARDGRLLVASRAGSEANELRVLVGWRRRLGDKD
jgi:serine/threonine protein kinase/Tol biopolymer transport system component